MQNLADHIVSGYDDELNGLTTTVAELGGLVETMVADALRAIDSRDSELAKDIVLRDRQANKLQQKVDEDALRLLALRHPMATDLRRVIGAIRVANDLERVGDLASGIAKRAISINKEDKIDLSRSAGRIGKLVKSQLSNALDALMREDSTKSVETWLADNDVDEMYNASFRELLTYMMGDPRTITTCASLLFVAKNLERIADHATNICEVVYFTVEAKPLINDPAVEQAQAH